MPDCSIMVAPNTPEVMVRVPLCLSLFFTLLTLTLSHTLSLSLLSLSHSLSLTLSLTLSISLSLSSLCVCVCVPSNTLQQPTLSPRRERSFSPPRCREGRKNCSC